MTYENGNKHLQVLTAIINMKNTAVDVWWCTTVIIISDPPVT